MELYQFPGEQETNSRSCFIRPDRIFCPVELPEQILLVGCRNTDPGIFDFHRPGLCRVA